MLQAWLDGKMRVGVVTAFPPGHNSLNEFGWHLVTNLAAKPEVDEVLLFADATDHGAPISVENVSTRVCWRFNGLANLFTIARAVRRSKPDALLFSIQFATFGDRRLAGGLGLLTPALTKLMGTPTAVILHNLSENVDMKDAGFASNRVVASLLSAAGTLLTKALLRADYVAVTIPRYVEMLRTKYRADNVLLAPHGAFTTVDRPRFDSSADRRDVLAFGKWGTYKTLDVLIAAYRSLLAREGYDDVRIVIAGTDSPNAGGYLATVQNECADLPGVVFTGYVAEDDIAELFESAAVTVFPYTSTTGSSGVLHQAGSYGKAAVIPSIGDFAEVIAEEGFVGEYFEPGDADSLADALATMLDDPQRCRRHGEQNFAAATGIPIDEVLDWHLLHLESVISGRAA